MIKPGINENVIVAQPTINEKGTLEVNFTEFQDTVRATSGGFDDTLGALSSSDDDTSGESTSASKIMMFPFDTKSQDGKVYEVAEIVSQISGMKDPLNHILKAFLTSDKIRWNIMVGTGLDNKQLNDQQKQALMLRPDVLDVLYKNIVNEFLRMYALIPNPKATPMRMLFLRRSQQQHYIAFRRRFLGDNPFIEPMTIPLEKSRLRFSQWEKDKGLDNPDPVKTNKDEEAAPSSASGLLGQAPQAAAAPQAGNLMNAAPAPQAAPQQQAPAQQQVQQTQPVQQPAPQPAPAQAPQQPQQQPASWNPEINQFEQQAGQPTQAFPQQPQANPAQQLMNQQQPQQPQQAMQSQANTLLGNITQ